MHASGSNCVKSRLIITALMAINMFTLVSFVFVNSIEVFEMFQKKKQYFYAIFKGEAKQHKRREDIMKSTVSESWICLLYTQARNPQILIICLV